MEEILASIRRIISENDDGEGKTGDPKAKAVAKPEQESVLRLEPDQKAEEDILELTDVVENEGKIASDVPAKDSAGRGDVVMEDASSAPRQVSRVAETVASDPRKTGEEESLVSMATAAASTAALTQLAQALDRDPRAVGNIALGSGNTLEDLVKDMIRPMLKEWLDQNLPPIVERLVRREIERMVRRAEDQA